MSPFFFFLDFVLLDHSISDVEFSTLRSTEHFFSKLLSTNNIIAVIISSLLPSSEQMFNTEAIKMFCFLSQIYGDSRSDCCCFSGATANSNSTDEVPKYGCAGLLFASYLGHLTSVMNLVEVSLLQRMPSFHLQYRVQVDCTCHRSKSSLRKIFVFSFYPLYETLQRDSKLISTRDPRGRSALHLAAWRGHYQCVEYLIEKGIDIEAVDDSGATALMYAVRDPVSVHIVGERKVMALSFIRD